MTTILPRLETLPKAQQVLWPLLSAVKSDFVLYGGTALALQVGGRKSVDFDFFTERPLEPERMAKDIPFLFDARLRGRAEDTAVFLVEHGSDVVAVSIFGSPGFGRVSEPVHFADNGIYAAGLMDLAAQKMKVIQQRAEAKDYLDIHTLLSSGITLEMALGAAQALYPEFNAAISLKALTYFKDVAGVAPDIQSALTAASARVRDIPIVPKISSSLLPELGSKSHASDLTDWISPGETGKPNEPELEI